MQEPPTEAPKPTSAPTEAKVVKPTFDSLIKPHLIPPTVDVAQNPEKVAAIAKATADYTGEEGYEFITADKPLSKGGMTAVDSIEKWKDGYRYSNVLTRQDGSKEVIIIYQKGPYPDLEEDISIHQDKERIDLFP